MVGCFLLISYMLYLIARPQNNDLNRLVTHLVFTCLMLLAVISAWKTVLARELDPNHRALWRYLAIAFSIFLLGRIATIIAEQTVFTSITHITFSNVFYLLVYPAIFMTFPILKKYPFSLKLNWGFFFDFAICIAAIWMYLWYFIGLPLFFSGHFNIFGLVLILLVQLFNVVTIALYSECFIQTLNSDNSPTFALLVLGFFCFSTYIIFNAYALVETQINLTVSTLLGGGAFLIFAIAALQARSSARPAIPNPKTKRFLNILRLGLPLAGFLTGLALIIAVFPYLFKFNPLFEIILTSFGILTLFTLSRQVLTILENQQFSREIALKEARFRAIANYTSEWENWISPSGKLLWVNQAVERVTGCSPQECLDMPGFPLPLVVEEDQLKVREGFAQAFHGIAGNNLLFRIKHRNGEIRWVLASWQTIFDEDGLNLGYRSSIRDITEAKKNEIALQKRDAILEAVGFASEMFVKSSSWQTVMPSVLEYLGSATGVSRVYIVEKHNDPDGNFRTRLRNEWCYPGISSQMALESNQTYLLSPQAVQSWEHYPVDLGYIQVPIATANLTTFPEFLVEGTKSQLIVPIFVHQQWWGIVGFDDCLFERVWLPSEIEVIRIAVSTLGAAIERGIDETEFRGIVEQSSDGIVMTDEQGRIVLWNHGQEELSFTVRQKVLGEYLWDVVCDWIPQDQIAVGFRARMQIAIQKYLRNGTAEMSSPIIERDFLLPDGETHLLQIQVNPIRSENGFKLSFMVRDVTKRKALEAAEMEQRIMVDALRDSASVLTATLDLGHVLDHILINAGKIVKHDASTLMTIENGWARIIRSQGYIERGLAEYINHFGLEISKVPNMRSMIETGKPQLIPDVHAYPEWIYLPEAAWICSLIAAPIRIKGQTIGFINLDSTTPNFFNQTHAERLMTFANHAAIAIENARLYSEIQELAITDELTGLYNRRGFIELGRREIDRAHRFNRPLTILFFDIDHFKLINDRFSDHFVGDLVLKAVANRCRSIVRAVDIVCRYGGEEFVVLLPETNLRTARKIAERIRTEIAFDQTDSIYGPVTITVSIGLAKLTNTQFNLIDLVDIADKAMYSAKQLGRNRVVIAQQEP